MYTPKHSNPSTEQLQKLSWAKSRNLVASKGSAASVIIFLKIIQITGFGFLGSW